MTDDLRRLLAEATPGPWKVEYSTGVAEDEDGNEAESGWMSGPRMLDMGDYQALREEDAALIVAAVNALPALLDVVDAARKFWALAGWTGGAEAADVLDTALDRLEATR